MRISDWSSDVCSSDLADKYNNALKLRFMRENGIADGQRAYDDFITRLANSHSDGVQTAGFCQMADTLLSLATDAGANELPMLARNFSENPARSEEHTSVLQSIMRLSYAVFCLK